MNLKTSQIIQINQNYGSHRKSEVTDNHGRHKTQKTFSKGNLIC